MDALTGVILAGVTACRRARSLALFCLCLILLTGIWSGSVHAADNRCPIIILPSASGSALSLVSRQDLPDGPPAKPGAKPGLYGRDSLADDFEQSKPAPFWDQTSALDRRSYALTSAGIANGLRAMLLTVHHGDEEAFLEDKATGERRCTERAEIGEASDYWPPIGDDLWYGFALYLPADLPLIDRRLTLMQIRQAAGKRAAGIFTLADSRPALALRLKEIPAAKVLCLYLTPGNDDLTDTKPLAVVQLARMPAPAPWHNIVLHLRLSPGSSANSAFAWWFDDQPVTMLRAKAVTLGFKDGGAFSYFKLGPYRDQAIKGSREAEGDWTIGYDAVKREIGYPGRPGDPLTEKSVAPVPIDPAVTLGDTGACRKALGF